MIDNTLLYDETPRICRGKDINISFAVTRDGEAADLSSLDLKVTLCDEKGFLYTPQFSTDDNIISFTFAGIQQKRFGAYSVRVWENFGRNAQTMLDLNNLFVLVPTTEDEFIPDDGNTEGGYSTKVNIGGTEVKLGTTNIFLANAKSAYDAAREKGFVGTEEEFNEILSNARPVDNLDDDSDIKPLSANQGRVLNEKIEKTHKWFNLDNN